MLAKLGFAVGLLGLTAVQAVADDYLQDDVRRLELQQRMMQSDLFWQRMSNDLYNPAPRSNFYVVPRYEEPMPEYRRDFEVYTDQNGLPQIRIR